MKIISLIIKTVFLFSIVIYSFMYYQKNQLIKLENQFSESSLADPVRSEIASPYLLQLKFGDYDYQATAMYDYQVSGAVVQKKDYGFLNRLIDSGIPYDLCLAWGDNLKNGLYLDEKANFRQDNRDCFSDLMDNKLFNVEQIANHSLIINDKKVLEDIKRVNIGDEILLKGRLVNVKATAPDNSSSKDLTWTYYGVDTVAGSDIEVKKDSPINNELLFVDSVEIVSQAHYRENIISDYALKVIYVSGGLTVLVFVISILFISPKKRQYNI